MPAIRTVLLVAVSLAPLAACASSGRSGSNPAPRVAGASLHDDCPPLPFPSDLASRAGTEATLAGYVVPLEFDPVTDGVTEFMLTSRAVACCEGEPPSPEEWAHVVMARGSFPLPAPDEAVEVRGRLLASLPRDIREAGGLYALEAKTVVALANAPR